MTDKTSDGDREVGLIGGVEKREIVLSLYQPQWPQRFQEHRRAIAGALGDVALGIEHIGSTSVPGLVAKPIIDILVIVADSGEEASYLPMLEACGYELRVREPGFEEHRMLRTPEKKVHIHVFSEGSPEIERYLLFRDHLRKNSRDCERYQKLKKQLAANDWQDMNAYADAKSEFIEEIIAVASHQER